MCSFGQLYVVFGCLDLGDLVYVSLCQLMVVQDNSWQEADNVS